MSVCETVKIPKKKVCSGDLRNPIAIQTRTQTPKSFGSVDFDEVFTTVFSPRAAITTNRGFKSFNSVGINDAGGVTSFTHVFYIRNNPSFEVTSQNFILFIANRYKITEVINMGERNEFLELRAVKKGIDTTEANKV